MAEISFPLNPANNDVYTVNGRYWRWDGVSWNSIINDNYNRVLFNDNGNANTIPAGSNGQVLTSNGTGVYWGSSSGLPVTVGVLGADVTSANSTNYTTIFTIPLTASSGNMITAYLLASSDALFSISTGIQARIRVDQSTTNGFFFVESVTGSGGIVNANFPANSSPSDDGSSEVPYDASLNQHPFLKRITGTFITGSTPGNAIIEFQSETSSSVRINAGSYYIKAP